MARLVDPRLRSLRSYAARVRWSRESEREKAALRSRRLWASFKSAERERIVRAGARGRRLAALRRYRALLQAIADRMPRADGVVTFQEAAAIAGVSTRYVRERLMPCRPVGRRLRGDPASSFVLLFDRRVLLERLEELRAAYERAEHKMAECLDHRAAKKAAEEARAIRERWAALSELLRSVDATARLTRHEIARRLRKSYAWVYLSLLPNHSPAVRQHAIAVGVGGIGHGRRLCFTVEDIKLRIARLDSAIAREEEGVRR